MLIHLAAWLLLAATLAGFGGRLWWGLGLIAPFRVQLMAAAALAVLVLLARWMRRRTLGRSLPLAAATAALLINMKLSVELYSPALAPPAPLASTPALTVMFFNVNYGNHRLDELADIQPIARAIDESSADIVVVAEVTMHRLGVLRRALPGYRMAAGQGRPDPFGIAMFVRRRAEEEPDARLRVHSAELVELTGGLTDVLQAELRCTWAGRPLSVLGLHTISAVHAGSDRHRAAMLAGAAAWANRQHADGRACIIAGDFNATPWCPPFVDLLDDTWLTNSMQGFGAKGTWPAQLPIFMRIPIDHCLHSFELSTSRHEIGPDAFGSDHLPLTVELRWHATDSQATY